MALACQVHNVARLGIHPRDEAAEAGDQDAPVTRHRRGERRQIEAVGEDAPPQHRPDFASPPHVHRDDCLTVMLAGDMGKDDRALSGGAVALGARGPLRQHRRTRGRRRDARARCRRAASSRFGCPWLGRRLAAEVAATDAAAALALHAAALELLATVGRAPEGPKPSAWLDEVADHLHDRLFERVTLAELADVAGVHRTHLVRAFRAHHGVSVGMYVRRERVRWAARELRATDVSIADIAVQPVSWTRATSRARS